MGEFHLVGLAKEFDMRDSVKKTIKWKKGQTPTITDGWQTSKTQPPTTIIEKF